MISHFTGGNTMQPPEPVLSRADWERERDERAATSARRLFVMRAERAIGPCPIPRPTSAQFTRAALHWAHTKARRINPKTTFPPIFPLFDDEPTVRCEEVRHV